MRMLLLQINTCVMAYYVCNFAGDKISMDVATVHHGNQFLKYNVSMLGYGFYGDILADSEHHRWMGPKRYDWSGN
jgi:ceramide kinase